MRCRQQHTEIEKSSLVPEKRENKGHLFGLDFLDDWSFLFSVAVLFSLRTLFFLETSSQERKKIGVTFEMGSQTHRHVFVELFRLFFWLFVCVKNEKN